MTGSTRRESLLKWAEKRRLDYVARHGSMPLCACGCGREVAICTSSGKPNKLYERSCQQRARSMAASGKLKWIIAEAEGDLIPIDRFREIVRRVKVEKGMTWAELAEAGGVGSNTLRSCMSSRSKKWVRRDWATDFFTRLAGGAVAPSTSVTRRRVADDITINGRRSTQIFAERL